MGNQQGPEQAPVPHQCPQVRRNIANEQKDACQEKAAKSQKSHGILWRPEPPDKKEQHKQLVNQQLDTHGNQEQTGPFQRVGP